MSKILRSVRKTLKIKKQTLQNTYGTVILPKGLILYHTSSSLFNPINKDSMIFFTFHPSEWSNFPDEVVTKVQLNKSLRLFFMVKNIYKFRIHSLLNTLTNSLDAPFKNLNKQYDINLKCYVPYLLAENLDGWFSTVENKTAVEIALINNPSYYTVLSTQKTVRRWVTEGDYKTNINYPVYTQQFPIKMCIHKKYKQCIEDYMKGEICFIFQLVLENAQMEYFDGPTTDILWKC
jgi:hypothetical protein